MERIIYSFFGLDLGFRHDFSALAAIDLVEDIGSQRDPVTFAFHTTRKLCVRGIRRYPLGTPYTAIPEMVRRAVRQHPAGHFGVPPKSVLAVDAGGPGLPVVELLRQARLACSLLPAIITGGNSGSLLAGGVSSVPRKELVTLLRLGLENRMLVFPTEMPLKRELIAELAAVESDGGQSKHDDMAIAIALALWAGTKRFPDLLQQEAA